MSDFTAERLSDVTWKVVENDRYGQYPFLYIIIGIDKCIIFDTGCGTGDFRNFVNTHLNTQHLPYLIICSHCHFDHIGGNYQFFGDPKCLGVMMGGNDKVFTENFEINSLALAHSGATVKHFGISRWLEEGDLIYMDDSQPVKEKSLQVIFTPGHTSDSIALFSHFENRLFVGDNIYPYTAIHLDCIGSNVKSYIESLRKLREFVASIKNRNVHQLSESAKAFLDFVGLREADALASFDVEGILSISGSVEGAVELFFGSDRNELSAMFPPKQSGPGSDIMLSCAHVEANLPPSSITDILDFLSLIRGGFVTPSHVDGNYGEFTHNTFTIMLPLNPKWE